MNENDRESENGAAARRGFTLIELLTVVATIAILAALLLPVLANVRASGKQTACLSNLKQLQIAFQMYAADNGGKLTQNLPNTEVYGDLLNEINNGSPWMAGNLKTLADSTNLFYVRAGKLFPYAPEPGVYRCPSDASVGGGTSRVRSYSMNAWVGSKGMELLEEGTPYRTFLKESDFAATDPSRIWVFTDEHILTLSDVWFIVTINDSDPFERMPAMRHVGGYCLNFADGHAEVYHWRATAHIAETQSLAFSTERPPEVSSTDRDWIKLKNVTTTR